MPRDSDTAMGGPRHRFPTTRHSLVEAAAGKGDLAREALSGIALVYWKPAYKYIRMQWNRPNEEAKDLVQGFFTTLIEQDMLSGFDPSKGRLRTWLRSCLDHYVMKQDEAAGRLKRGGGIEFAAFDFDVAEREIAAASPSAEDIFFREWQREMFALALNDLRDLCVASGKQLQHRIFEQYDLADESRPSYADLAREHHIPVTSVTNYLAWARRELRRLVMQRLSAVTSNENECRAELRLLLGQWMSYLPDRTLDHLRAVAETPDLSGTRYRIEGELGRGGMGIVYRAWDTQLERAVALKVIDFETVEPKVLARLEHPGLAPVYDSGELPDGRVYYAMRLVAGKRLDDFLNSEPSLHARLRVLQKVCDAVAFAHDRGVIHCDLKPQNIMVGGFGEVFVMDWGIANSSGAGTPPYMPPEKTRDRRSDVYSLGRILEDLMGTLPPRSLLAVARRAVAQDPAARYSDVQQLAGDLTRFLDGQPVSAHPESLAERTGRFIRRNQVLLLLLAAFFLVKLAFFFFRLR